MYRFLLTPRWLAVSVLALLAVPLCIFMGSWQLSRFHVRVDDHRSAKATEARTASQAPVPLTGLLPDTRAQVTSDGSGRPVTATGHFDSAHQLLVPDRTLGDRTGYYVLTPLRVDGGAGLPVVRGWLPGKASDAHSGTVPPAPAGEITVTGALQYPETSGSDGVYTGGALPSGQLGIISAASLVNLLPYPVYSGWITAVHPVAPLEAVPPMAPPDSGLDLRAFQNLGYTGQWFVFAAFVVFMWFRLVRREGEAQADTALGLLPEQPVGGAGTGTAADGGPGHGASGDQTSATGSTAHVA